MHFDYKKISYGDITFSGNREDCVLGEGAQAKVYGGCYQGQPVALKVFNLNESQCQKVKYFTRELKALVSISHKNVISYIGAGQHINELFLVLERGSNEHLLQYIIREKKTWPNKYRMPARWVYALSRLAEGLQSMSDSGVLHRDLTVNNIMIFEQPPAQLHQPPEEQKAGQQPPLQKPGFELKITDFGVSAFESDKHQIVRGSTRYHPIPRSQSHHRSVRFPSHRALAIYFSPFSSHNFPLAIFFSPACPGRAIQPLLHPSPSLALSLALLAAL